MSYETRQARANYPRYIESRYGDIYSAYKKPSRKKWEAWNKCRKLCAGFDGFGLRVISKNTYTFTAGFEYVHPDTGELLFMFIAPSYNAIITPC